VSEPEQRFNADPVAYVRYLRDDQPAPPDVLVGLVGTRDALLEARVYVGDAIIFALATGARLQKDGLL